MKARKTLIILFGVFLFVLMLGVGAGVYYYTHPYALKALMEKAVSRAIGGSLSVQQLAYSMNPIRINAKGVVFEPAGVGDGFSIKIQDFMAECFLNGSFGKKTLVCRSLRVNGFECRIREGTAAPTRRSESKGPSYLGSAARILCSFFLFKDFKLQACKMEDGVLNARWGNRRIQLSRIGGHLNADHLMDIRGGMRVDSPTENATFKIPEFHIKTHSAISLSDPKIGFTLAFPDGFFESPEGQVKKIRAGAAIHYDHRKQKMIFTDLYIKSGETRLKGLPQTAKVPLGISLETEGDIDLRTRKVRAHGLSFNVNRLLEFEGSVNAGFGAQPDFRVRIGEGLVFSHELVSLLQKGIEKKPGGWSISGPINFSGIFSGHVKQNKWVFNCNMEGETKNSPASYRSETVNVNGLLTSHVALEGPVTHLRLSGRVRADEFSCRISKGKGLAGKRIFSVDRIEISSSKGEANLGARMLNFPEIRIESSLLKNIFAALRMDDGNLALTVKGKETELSRAAMALKLLPPGWSVRGTDTFHIEATGSKREGISFSSKLAYEKLAFKNLQETCAGENMSLRAHVSGRMTFPELTVKTVAVIEAHEGEVLMDRFYFDLKETPSFARFKGAYNRPLKRLILDGVTLGMKKIATAQVTGTLMQVDDGYEGEFSMEIPDTPLKGPFQRLVREPFQTEKPALAAVKLDGIFSAKMTLKGNLSHWVTKGFCTWKDGSLSYGDSVAALTGIDLLIPVWLANGNIEGPGQNLEGGLSVRSMRVPFLPEQGLSVSLQAASNCLFMPNATALAVPGGRIRIGPSKIVGLTGPSPVMATALHFENLQMEPILSGIWPRSVKGVAVCDLDPIHIEGGNLKSFGTIKANVFGGDLTLSHVGARGLFTALPVFSADASWQELNLAEITGGTSFGKIEGVLNGYAKRLEVSNGQLQRFDLLLGTVKTDGVPQKISVKAVDNIARLGGGQSPFIGLAGIFVSLFREFPYDKIGVHATLENDIFRINGTIREDGKEYLVKRGFFSGVDVINQSKDNRVGFKDMLKRMKRVTDAEAGPVIR